MKNYAIIVAGGSGSRMQTDIPKQFLLLNGLPVVMHTINAFFKSTSSPEIFLVLHSDQHDYWNKLCSQYHFDIPHRVIDGGSERFFSVKNALSLIDSEGYVAIHDAVRPLITSSLIDKSFFEAVTLGNVIVAVPSSDSVRLVQKGKTSSLKRDEIYLVQTPQTFSTSVLKAAYSQEYSAFFTDDASVVESAGYTINIIEGERNNIKITYPVDLELASILMRK